MAKVTITKNPIAPSSVIKKVMIDKCGGIVVFIGTIRDSFMGKHVRKVFVEAYDLLARKDLQNIVDDVQSKYDIAEIIVTHRIGELSVGDVVVTIAVSAAHRKEAFEACEEIIDRMKKTTPIWKQEFFDDGSRWVEGDVQ